MGNSSNNMKKKINPSNGAELQCSKIHTLCHECKKCLLHHSAAKKMIMKFWLIYT